MKTSFIDALKERKSNFPAPEEALDKANACDIISKDIYTDHTRFIFELLQNADDASCKSGSLNFRIDFVGQYLVVSHKGKAFTEDDIESLCSIGSGTKASDAEQTGFKGIGFKSVFAHSKCVIIKSGEYCFKFDQACSTQWNSKWGNQEEWENKRQSKGMNTCFKMPWQIIPFNTELPQEVSNLLGQMGEYTVSTIITCKDIKSFKTAIEDLFSTAQLILFLRSKNISVLINGTRPLTITKTVNDGITSIAINGQVISRWLMHTTSSFDVPQDLRDQMEEDSDHYPEKLREAKKASFSFAIAIKHGKIDKIDDEQNNIFAYLPTTVKDYSFPFLVNANFITDAGRQNLHKDYAWNQWLFSEMPKQYLSWMVTIAQEKKFGLDYLNTIAVTIGTNDELARKYKEGMRTALKETAFFYCNGSWRTPEQVLLDETNLFSCISQDLLIQYINADDNHSFSTSSILPQEYTNYVSVLKSLNVTIFENKMIKDFVETDLFKSSHNQNENAQLIMFLCKRYSSVSLKECDLSNNALWLKSVPFIYSERGIMCAPEQLCFPRINFSTNSVNVYDTIATTVYDTLTQNCKEWLKNIGVSEPSDTSLIDTWKLFDDDFVTTSNALEIGQYIFNLHLNNTLTNNQYLHLHNLKLITQKGALKKADDLYLANKYVPDMSLEQVLNYDMFVSDQYIQSNNQKSEWKVFLEKIGVKSSLDWQRMSIIKSSSDCYDTVDSHFMETIFNQSTTFYWESWGPWNDHSGWRFYPSGANIYGIPYMNCATDHTLSVKIWDNLLRTKSYYSIEEDAKILYIYGATGSISRSLDTENFRGRGYETNYLKWLVENKPIIPATDGKCYYARDIFCNIDPDIQNLIGNYLPIFDYNGKVDFGWNELLGMKTVIEISDLLSVLSQLQKEEAVDKESKDRIIGVYTLLAKMNRSYYNETNMIKQWAENNEILGCDNKYHNPSKLNLVMVEGLEDNQSAYIGRGKDENIIELMKLFGVKVIENLEPSYGESTLCNELTQRFKHIAPLIVHIKDGHNASETNDIIDRISFYSVDSITLSYGDNNDFAKRTTYYDESKNAILFVGNWNDSRTLDSITQLLGNILHMKKDAHMLNVMLTSTLSESIDYLQENGMPISNELAVTIRENEPVSIYHAKQEDGTILDIAISDSQYGGLSHKDMASYLEQAKSQVRQTMERQGFDFSSAVGLDASTYGNVYGVKDSQGVEYPLVVHSYRNNTREFALTAMDWKQLAQRNSMLWLVTASGAKCVEFYKLMAGHGRISLGFNVDNCESKSKMIALAEIMRDFRGLHFDFGSLQDTFSNIAVRFNQPEKELAEKLGSDDLEMLF